MRRLECVDTLASCAGRGGFETGWCLANAVTDECEHRKLRARHRCGKTCAAKAKLAAALGQHKLTMQDMATVTDSPG